MSISSNLKELRSQRGLTQGDLAKLANIELTQISRIERGASEPKLETIKKLSNALQCSADELIMDSSNNRKEPEYIKIVVNRIRNLTPLKRYIALELLESYLNQNEVKEPSLHLQYEKGLTKEDVNVMVNDNFKDEILSEERLVDEISNELNETRKNWRF